MCSYVIDLGQISGSQTHSVVVGEPRGGFLGAAGRHAFLLDCYADWVPEAGPHQLLQLLGLSG